MQTIALYDAFRRKQVEQGGFGLQPPPTEEEKEEEFKIQSKILSTRKKIVYYEKYTERMNLIQENILSHENTVVNEIQRKKKEAEDKASKLQKELEESIARRNIVRVPRTYIAYLKHIRQQKIDYAEKLAQEIPLDDDFFPNYWTTKSGKEFLRENPPIKNYKKRRLNQIIGKDKLFGQVEATLTQTIKGGSTNLDEQNFQQNMEKNAGYNNQPQGSQEKFFQPVFNPLY